jgi:DNA (cytosine-5)-methyltransferase 1
LGGNFLSSHKQFSCGATFSGIGGFCFGFEAKNFNTKWAIDNDSDAASTYSSNFPTATVYNEDIVEFSIGDRFRALEQVDVIHGGFPCQSFSTAGNKLGFDDPRGQLFFELMKVVTRFRENKPSILVFENAPFLKLGQGGAWFARIKFEIQRAGYLFNDSNCIELDTHEHSGLPQRRRRLFLIAVNKDKFHINPPMRPSKLKEWQSLNNHLQLSGTPEEYFLPEDNKYTDLLSQAHRKKVTDPEKQLVQLRRRDVRVHKIDTCPTLTANMGEGGHNVPFVQENNRLRKLTEVECLSLQGFPSSFVFEKGLRSKDKYRLIGNAVSPLVSQLVANHVKSLLTNQNLLIR